jgi:hypothetical protein
MKGLDFKTTQSIYFRNSARKQTGETNAARLRNPIMQHILIQLTLTSNRNTLNYIKRLVTTILQP